MVTDNQKPYPYELWATLRMQAPYQRILLLVYMSRRICFFAKMIVHFILLSKWSVVLVFNSLNRNEDAYSLPLFVTESFKKCPSCENEAELFPVSLESTLLIYPPHWIYCSGISRSQELLFCGFLSWWMVVLSWNSYRPCWPYVLASLFSSVEIISFAVAFSNLPKEDCNTKLEEGFFFLLGPAISFFFLIHFPRKTSLHFYTSL